MNVLSIDDYEVVKLAMIGFALGGSGMLFGLAINKVMQILLMFGHTN